MLIILILLLTFTDFELSGQKVETEAIYVSAKFKEFNFINILEHIIYYLLICYYIVSCMSVYRHMRKNNKPVRSENPQDIFQKGCI